MPAEVLFAPARMRKLAREESLPYKLRKALEKSSLPSIVEKGNVVAIKVHVGDMERGGFRFVRPFFR